MQLRHISLVQRWSNALVSYARYVGATIWPDGLAVFYPHPASVGVDLWPEAGAASVALLLAISGLALAQARRRPYLIVGWTWFVGALVPMIGLVQVGAQAMADRYTYLPSIGLFLAAVWGASELCTQWAVPRTAVIGGFCVILVGSAALTWRQVARWQDAFSLYEHALRVTERNWLAWNNLGVQYLQRGEPARALEMLETSRSIMPGNALAWYNSGVALAEMGRPGEALSCYRESARLDPSDERTLINLGVLLLDLGQAAEAIVWLERALVLQPEHPVALYDLAIAHARHGDPARASEYARRLRSVDPAQAAELLRLTGGGP